MVIAQCLYHNGYSTVLIAQYLSHSTYSTLQIAQLFFQPVCAYTANKLAQPRKKIARTRPQRLRVFHLWKAGIEQAMKAKCFASQVFPSLFMVPFLIRMLYYEWERQQATKAKCVLRHKKRFPPKREQGCWLRWVPFLILMTGRGNSSRRRRSIVFCFTEEKFFPSCNKAAACPFISSTVPQSRKLVAPFIIHTLLCQYSGDIFIIAKIQSRK